MKEMLNDCVILRQTKSGTIRLSRSNTKSKEFGNYLKDFLGTTLNRISFTISKSSLESPDYIVDLDVRVENVLALSITFMKDECIYKYGYHAYVWFKYAKKLKSLPKPAADIFMAFSFVLEFVSWSILLILPYLCMPMEKYLSQLGEWFASLSNIFFTNMPDCGTTST